MMIDKKALLLIATALVTALVFGSLAVTRTARSEGETLTNPDILIFLQIDGIPGESTVALHEDWIDIDAFSWSEAMQSFTSVIGGRAAGKINMTAFQFAMKTSLASPKLFLACATGKVIPNAALEICNPGETGPVVFLRFNFDQVTISSYRIDGSAPMDRPVDEFSIAFTKITMTYWQFDEAGNVVTITTAQYDLITGKGGSIGPIPP